MNDPRNEYHLSDEDATAILLESPDTTLVADHLSGALSAVGEVAFQERLRLDPTFREFAESHIAAWESVPAAQPILSPDELHASWVRFQDRVGMPRERAVAPTANAERRPWPQLRRLQFAAALLLIIGIPGAVYMGGLVMPLMRSPVTRMVTTDFAGQNVVLGPTSSVTLARASRLVYNDKANANGRQELVLMEGQAMFILAKHPKGAYVVTTPAGRILVTGTKFHVEVRDPEMTFVMVEEGTVSLESVGAGSTYAPLQLRAGNRGLLMWGQPPQRAN